MQLQHFEAIRSRISGIHALQHNAPYLISFDVNLPEDRRQGIYLAELDGEEERKFLRVSTPIAPLTGVDPQRCLRFNWEQRTGYLAVSDLDGSPYLQLCENCPYDRLTSGELDRLIAELASLGDQLERALSSDSDAF